ncbi:MAG TPA: alpha/beta hydrolase [Acidimicrobiales bacterium]|nr:alpha/beta hydrolase [Acidimicrobiales bacterium]
MSSGGSSGRRRDDAAVRTWVARGVAAGTAVGLVAAWATQHRLVRRAVAAGDEGAPAEGLVLPGDLRRHDVATPDGGSIHVVERGRGPALLLLHGLMLTSDTWVHQFTDLADRHRVVAVDLRGHGRSVPGTAGFRAPGEGREPDLGESVSVAAAGRGAPAMVRMADDVRAVVEALDLRDCLLVGHSMGGMVALQLLQTMAADERRRRFSGVVLVSTSAGPFVTLPGWSAVAATAGAVSARAVLVAERAGASRLPSEDLRWWVSRLGFGPEPVPAQVRFVEQMHRGTPEGTLSQLVPSFTVFDLSAGMADVDVPALVVVGSKDRLLNVRHARRMAGALPRAELVELPRCGHMPMLERRHEFSRLLDEFSAKVR